MRFESRVSIPADQERVWQYLMQIPEVGRAVPGVTEVTPLDDDNFAGTMKVRLGPVALQLEGKLTVVTRDQAAGRAVLSAQAADRRAGGSVTAKIELQLRATGPTETELVVTTDANVLGKLGEFGQPLIRRRADQTMQEFARNLQAALS